METKREFSIKKIAVNSSSFLNTINENPKIIHVSCHGDSLNKSFYLAFEKEFTGEEEQFTEHQLKEVMLGHKDLQIKLAFINACHSQKNGRDLLTGRSTCSSLCLI